MSVASPTPSWCDKDQHHFFDHYADFNAWLEESDDALDLRADLGLDNLSQPAKALFAGDKAQYDQAFAQYKTNRRQEVLSRDYLQPLTNDEHWFERNVEHFEQLLMQMAKGEVVPFVGAGLSVGGRFPTWQDHLCQQGKTANIASEHIEAMLVAGEYETIIADIEAKRGRDTFIAEIRDVFGKNGTIPDAVWRLTQLFGDTVLTTNYDRLLEQAFGAGREQTLQIINALIRAEQPDAKCTTIVKLHGDITKPGKCILSKNQYDDAYGADDLDLSRPIPKLLSHYYQTTSLLFLGCSLNNDRTVHVFRAARQQAGDADFPQHFSIEQACDDPEAMAARNAMLENLGITNCDRSVQGTMNQMAGDFERMLWFEEAKLEDICSYSTGAWLADRPCTVKGQKDCIWPDRAMLALLNRVGNTAPAKQNVVQLADYLSSRDG